MSFQASIDRLQAPVKALVLSVSAPVGSTPEEEKEVVAWIDKTASGSLVSENNLKDLDTILVPKTYIATNYLTAADVALYGTLRPIVAKLHPPSYHAVPALTRYFNHIQLDATVRSAADSLGDFAVVELDVENAPVPVRQAAAPKKKEKKAIPASGSAPDASTPATAPAATAATAAASGSAAPAPAETSSKEPQQQQQQQQKKEKKEKKPKDASSAAAKPAGGKGGKAPAADEGEPVPSMIDLRVGHIVDIMKHPDADGLYVEQIDIGEPTGPRTVVSGLVNYIPIEQMRDKYLVAVCNLKPASMRGVKSFAMVLCATSKEGKEGGIELVQPPVGSKPGDRVFFEGVEFESATPLPQLNPKKKIFETIQPGFITLDTKEAAWVNPVTKSVHRIKSEKGVCVAPTFVGASLS